MPTGFHFGRSQFRRYTSEYRKLYAHTFKGLTEKPLGQYQFTITTEQGAERTPFELCETSTGVRYMRINKGEGKKPLEIALLTCSSSASNKLYISCPYCQERRQHLYRFKNGYACRACLKLHYASQSETKQSRLARRIRKLRLALWGYQPDIYNLIESSYYFAKPKYMRWKKFIERREAISALESEYWRLSEQQLRRCFGGLFLR
ncbi:hypothetical protein Q4519_06665 [Motilimonas sp. 1_MG-2023]|uniref:hypothetical protein n=1 Tax=Motilimonas sp. 1_MG-2023 TaxID=3062672 RepID=UPI0026E31AA5|nr:hypothetical protein [Motilimonas sp. 1_MG-2023]MDO6525365.1 hypothetical protein [Motilimonas sp. 1_MG-2023]